MRLHSQDRCQTAALSVHKFPFIEVPSTRGLHLAREGSAANHEIRHYSDRRQRRSSPDRSQRRRERIPRTTFQVRRSAKHRAKSVGFGLAGAVVLVAGFAFIYMIIFPALGLPVNESQMAAVKSMTLWFRFLLVVRAAVFEEIYYRGFAIERITEVTGLRWLASLISLAAFTFAETGRRQSAAPRSRWAGTRTQFPEAPSTGAGSCHCLRSCAFGVLGMGASHRRSVRRCSSYRTLPLSAWSSLQHAGPFDH
jgi:hypothetical protein